MDKLPLSVAIISFNEEEKIGRTLEAICDIASEIIVVDSHSTDKTVEIAEKFNAKVYIEDWKGHIAQKNSALEKCSQKWILSLDCDEVVTPELKKDIYNQVSNGIYDGYFVNRKTVYSGKKLNYAWQPDKKLRLVTAKSEPRWQGLDPHDELHINGRTTSLQGDLLHYSFKDVYHHFEITVKYAQISALSYHKHGRKFSYRKLLLNPVLAFTKSYIIHKGFLDGYSGLLAASSNFFKTFLKYVFLKEVYLNRKQNND